MVNRALTEIRNINLGNAVKISSTVNMKSAQCISKEATSAKLRCSLSSNLINLKSVSNAFLDFASSELTGINSEIHLNLNSDFLLKESTNDIGKLLILDYRGTWYMNENTIDSSSFESDKIPNSNVLDAIIPPSSCFNMEMSETLEKFRVHFSAIATIAIYNDVGERYLGVELTNIKNNIKSTALVFDEKVIQLPIEGYLDINVLGTDSSIIIPCSEG